MHISNRAVAIIGSRWRSFTRGRCRKQRATWRLKHQEFFVCPERSCIPNALSICRVFPTHPPYRPDGVVSKRTPPARARIEIFLFPIPRFTRASVEPENRGFLTSVSPQPRPSASAMTSSTMAPGCPGLRPRTRIAKTGDAPGRPCQHCTRRLDIPCFRLVK